MTEAEKREKVIRGLECCLSPNDHQNCPYDGIGKTYSHCLKQLVTDAFALLKEQEPRVMTFEEIKDNMGVPVWVEYADDENWNGYGVPTSDLETCIMIFGANAYCVHNARSVNVSWRCWTSRPTPEQMRETKWEEAENADMR